jgi:hypothetical protein
VRTAELPRVHKGRESVKLSLGLTPESFPKKRGSDRSNPLKPYLVARVPTHAQSENVQSNSKKKKKKLLPLALLFDVLRTEEEQNR